MTRAEKIAANEIDKRIEAAYRARCLNVTINMMDIAKIFAVGRKAVAEGADDSVLSDKIAAFVQTIRRN